MVNWLQSGGFTIDGADLRMRQVRFSGTAGQVQQTLGTTILTNGHQYANAGDPKVPQAIGQAVVAFFGLSNFAPEPLA